MGAEVLPVLITGGNGRIGRFLREAWPWAMRDGLRPIWQARRDLPGCVSWDILNRPCPPLLASGIVIALAGRTEPAAEAPLALAELRAAAEQGARHVFMASSSAVYGAGEGLTEESPVAPVSAYARAKAEAEAAALDWAARQGPGAPGLTLLRIGNVVGAGGFLVRSQGPVQIDRTPDGRGPIRSWIGPLTLAGVLARLAVLAAAREPLPQVLNVAAPRPLPMADMLDAAGIDWSFAPENPASLPALTLDTTRLRAIQRLPPQSFQPKSMVAEWRHLERRP